MSDVQLSTKGPHALCAAMESFDFSGCEQSVADVQEAIVTLKLDTTLSPPAQCSGKMRVAMFTDSYLPSRDGVVTSILLSKKSLEKLGHEVFIFAPEPDDKSKKEDGVHYFKSKRFIAYNGYFVPMFPEDNCSILKRLDVDVIHAHGMMFMGLRGMFAAKNLRLPIVASFHTMITEAIRFYNFTPLPDWLIDRMMWTYLRDFMERADSIIAPTNVIRDELLRHVPDIRHIEVIPTGVDTERFNPRNDGSRFRATYGLENSKVILTVGRIAREKNLDLVLKGFKVLHTIDKDTKLVIAGDGPAKAYVKNMVKTLGIEDSTLFPGFIPDNDLPELYAACDAFTIASKFETQGLVVLEAMASGKPVSGINHRAIAEIVTDCVNGFTFYEDPASWAKATKCALEATDGIRTRARESAEAYSLQESAKRTIGLYDYSIKAKRERLAKRRG